MKFLSSCSFPTPSSNYVLSLVLVSHTRIAYSEIKIELQRLSLYVDPTQKG